jgi:ATP-dependent Zn protease
VVSLNDFLKNYTENKFSKIVLEDETDLKGYEYLGTGKTVSLMSLNKNLTETYYNLLTTKKPINTSMGDLGISLTGAIPVDIVFNTQGWLSKLVENVGPILLFFVLFLFLLKFAMPKGG